MQDFDLLGNVNHTDRFGNQQPPGVMQTHGQEDCVGPNCCIHNPSDHPLKYAPLNWRSDRKLMERICEHGIGHPDPDDIDFKRSALLPELFAMFAFESHSCDGCCS